MYSFTTHTTLAIRLRLHYTTRARLLYERLQRAEDEKVSLLHGGHKTNSVGKLKTPRNDQLKKTSITNSLKIRFERCAKQRTRSRNFRWPCKIIPIENDPFALDDASVRRNAKQNTIPFRLLAHNICMVQPNHERWQPIPSTACPTNSTILPNKRNK